MGFWQALSALAPVPSALADAHALRLAQQQEQQQFAQESALRDAQVTAQKLAAQGEEQRIKQGMRPIFLPGSKPEFNPVSGTYQQPAYLPDKQTTGLVDVAGVSPEAIAKYQLDSFKKNRAAAAQMLPDASTEQLDYLAYTLSGLKPPAAKFTPLAGPAGQPQLGPDGKTWGVYGRNADGAIVWNPVGQDYKPPAAKTNPYLDWKAQNPNGTVEQYEAMLGRTRVNATGGAGTWTVAEGKYGDPILYNSKTGETREAPNGLHKSGYYAKNIAPLEAAKLNVQGYMDNQVFDGPGDLALQHAFFTATQPSAGFRMTKVQQDILQNSRSWLGSAEAKALHARTGQWYTPEQRQQIANAALSAIADKEQTFEGGPSSGSPTPAKSGNAGSAPKTAKDYLKSIGVQ